MVPLIDLKIQHRSIASEIEAAIKNVCDNTAFIISDEMRLSRRVRGVLRGQARRGRG